MKKLLLLVLAFVMFKVGNSQGYPMTQFIGTDSALVISKGAMQSRFVNVVFTDTSQANTQRIRQYPGAMIYAAGKMWVRNTTATGWTELAYGPIQVTNIYNSNGSLTSNRTLDGDGYSLTFDQIGGEFGVGADSINFAPASGKFRISSLNQGIGTKALRYNPVTKLITYSDTTSSVNIYNSDGTLTGNRELDADGNNLTFTAVRKFSLSGDSLDYTLDPAGNLRIGLGNQQFIMRSDTASLSRRISYTGNLGSSFTKHSLVDRNYVDSSITASPSGTVTSVGLSMPTAFAVANSPVTSSGTLTVTGAGVASQYIRGDGQLATLPTTGGGGSSVSYYLNGSVNQGTFGGTPYYEMSKTAIFGAGTDFNISSNGYIASFITDAGDPALLNIPAGNWDFEVYFQSSSASGTPSFYVELYKYDGTTFTLIASSSANPEFITGGTSVDAYYTPLAVPSTSLAVTDRLAVRIYVNNSGNTITLHTEDNNLCQIITTFSTGINALNGLTSQVQYFATGTSGTDFNINSLTDTHTFNLPTASATNRGALNSADWSTFNSKIGPSDTASMLSNYVTNAGYGLLKTTKTLSVDTLLISTRAWRQKGIDSVTSLINARPSGSGTTNYVSKWTSSSALGNSQIFDNGTNVGIGTASPSYKLDVIGDIRSSTGTYLTSATAGTAQGFANNGIGLVTFGVNTSGNALVVNDIDGAKFAFATGGFNTTFYKHRSTDNKYYPTFVIKGSGATSYGTGFDFYVGTSVAATIDNSGNMGIGLTSPANALHIDKGTGVASYSQFTAGTLTGQLATDGFEVGIDGSANAVINQQENLPMLFYTNNIERMRILQGGNVGIGTISPAAILDVSAANNEIRSTGTSSTYTQYNAFIPSGVNMRIGAFATNNGYLGTTTNHPFTIETNNTQRARFFANGNLLIGSGTTDPGYLLDVSGTARVREYLYMLRSDAGTTVAALAFQTGGTIDIGTTFRVIGNRWQNTTSSTSYIENGYTTKSFVSTPSQNGSFSSFDFSNSGPFSPTIPNPYTQKLINGAMTINSTAATNSFHGISISATDNSSSIANNVFAVYADATLGTNTSATRWAGYFVGNGYFSGNVGIGTTSINSSLEIYKASGPNYIYLTNGTSGTNNGVVLRFNNIDYMGMIGTFTTGELKVGGFNASGYFMTFYSNNAERMRLTPSGRLLLGTTTESTFLLDVNGTARVNGDFRIVTTTNARQLTFENATQRSGVNISQPNNTLTFNNGGTFELYCNNLTFFTSASTFFTAFQGSAQFIYRNTSSVNAWATLPDASVPYAWGRKLCLTGGTTITVPDASAVLDIQSTTMGFLPPRMTGAQAEAIASPATGLMVYANNGNGTTITSTGWWGYNGTTWVKLN